MQADQDSSSAANGAVLTDIEIRELVKRSGLISDFEEVLLKGASYDLRLGNEYSTSGRLRKLSEREPSCKLEPGQFILLTSLEHLKLPDYVVGHAGLMSKWAQSGLISLFSPQIDPGFEGLIIVPLFNGGDAPISLRSGEPMFTVEFIYATGRASTSWIDKHEPLLRIASNVNVQMGRPNFSATNESLLQLRHDLGALEARFQGFTDGTAQRFVISSTKAVWLAVFIAIAAFLVALLTLIQS